MFVTLIDGSPKVKRSVSGRLLDYLSGFIPLPYDRVRLRIDRGVTTLSLDADALVLAFPLYLDGLPSQVVHFLETVQSGEAAVTPGTKIYVAINNGMFEPQQCRLAVAMTRVFCNKADLEWGGALCVGGGPMMNFTSLSIGDGPMRSVGSAVREFARSVTKRETGDDIFVGPDVSRNAYIELTHGGWEKVMRKRGLTINHLYGDSLSTTKRS